MSKEELLKKIEEIDEQLKANYKFLEPYIGKEVEENSEIGYLYKLTETLMQARIAIRNEIFNKYGVFVM